MDTPVIDYIWIEVVKNKNIYIGFRISKAVDLNKTMIKVDIFFIFSLYIAIPPFLLCKWKFESRPINSLMSSLAMMRNILRSCKWVKLSKRMLELIPA